MNRIYTNALAGLLAASVVLSSTGCGQRSARFVSEPPESTPGWGDYTATQTEYESESETEEEVLDVRKAGALNPVYAEYDEADFPGLEPGWYHRDEGWYYFDDVLRMLTGWQEIDGVYYCMNEDGLMYADTIVDGWYVDADGKCQDEIPEGYTEPSSEDVVSAEPDNDEAAAAETQQQTIAETQAPTRQRQTAAAQGQTAAAQQQTKATQPQTTAAQRQTAAPETTAQSTAASGSDNVQSSAASGSDNDSASAGSSNADSKTAATQETSSEDKAAEQSSGKDSTAETTAGNKTSSIGETASRVIIHEETSKDDEDDEEETEKPTYVVSDGHEAGLRVH